VKPKNEAASPNFGSRVTAKETKSSVAAAGPRSSLSLSFLNKEMFYYFYK
jgi:hypothetical protein